MLKNEWQYKRAKAMVADIDGQAAALRAELAHQSELVRDLQVDALLGNLEQIRDEVAEYEAIRDGSEPIEAEGLNELPLLLIKARIRNGVTQRQLADRLGVAEQQVQRWEENDYHGVGFERLDEISRELGVRVLQTVSFVATA